MSLWIGKLNKRTFAAVAVRPAHVRLVGGSSVKFEVSNECRLRITSKPEIIPDLALPTSLPLLSTVIARQPQGGMHVTLRAQVPQELMHADLTLRQNDFRTNIIPR